MSPDKAAPLRFVRRGLTVVGALILLASVGTFGTFAWSFVQKARVASWRPVPATVEAVKVTGGGRNKHRRFECTYRYVVDGQEHRGQRLGPDGGTGAYLEEAPLLEQHLDTGEPITAFVDPADPSRACLFKHLSLTGLVIVPGYALLTALLGASMLRVMRTAERAARRREENVARPWRQEATWDGFRAAATESGTQARVLWALTLAGVVITAMAWAGLARETDAPLAARAGIPAALAALAGVIGAAAAYTTLRAWKYGTPTLHLATLPVVPGSLLEGEVRAEGALDARDGVALVLRCTRTTRKGKARTTEVVHEATVVVRESEVSVTSGGTTIPVRLPIPADAPDRDPVANPAVGWTLEARAATPGVDFKATFELPVHRVDASSVERRALGA